METALRLGHYTERLRVVARLIETGCLDTLVLGPEVRRLILNACQLFPKCGNGIAEVDLGRISIGQICAKLGQLAVNISPLLKYGHDNNNLEGAVRLDAQDAIGRLTDAHLHLRGRLLKEQPIHIHMEKLRNALSNEFLSVFGTPKDCNRATATAAEDSKGNARRFVNLQCDDDDSKNVEQKMERIRSHLFDVEKDLLEALRLMGDDSSYSFVIKRKQRTAIEAAAGPTEEYIWSTLKVLQPVCHLIDNLYAFEWETGLTSREPPLEQLISLCGKALEFEFDLQKASSKYSRVPNWEQLGREYTQVACTLGQFTKRTEEPAANWKRFRANFFATSPPPEDTKHVSAVQLMSSSANVDMPPDDSKTSDKNAATQLNTCVLQDAGPLALTICNRCRLPATWDREDKPFCSRCGVHGGCCILITEQVDKKTTTPPSTPLQPSLGVMKAPVVDISISENNETQDDGGPPVRVFEATRAEIGQMIAVSNAYADSVASCE